MDDAWALRVPGSYKGPVPSDWLVELEDNAPEPAPEVEEAVVRDELQELTLRLAAQPTSWSVGDAAAVRGRFDARARDWATRDNAAYRLPLVDALARGGVPAGGRCLEIGSGTGIQSPTLLTHFSSVVALDLSFEMLSRTPPGRGVQLLADAARLPVGEARIGAVVCVNAFLFAPEYVRVLAPTGSVVFVSTRAERTPIYLPPEEVVAALRAVDDTFHGATARAGQGCWTIARRG